MVAMAIRSGLWLRSFFLVSVSKLDQESRAYARAEQEQSDFEKAKGSVDEKRPVREQKARSCAAIRWHGGKRRERDGKHKREDRTAMEKSRTRERGRYDETGGKTKRREPQHREPSYWNLNNNYSV